jgi:hypothetical protein
VSLKQIFTPAVALLGVSLLLACDESAARSDRAKNPAAVAQPRALVETGNRQGPLASSLSGPDRARAGETLPLTLRIDRRMLHDSVEVLVEVNLPDGVALQQGKLRTRVLPDSEAVVELRYALRADALPDENVVFVLDAEGEGFGYHAELPYEFGRESAPPSAPERSAEAVRVAAKNFGASVTVPAED